jgi:threonylcarbamoyladenosine tRNA methylthiotransferase CDKAL1
MVGCSKNRFGLSFLGERSLLYASPNREAVRFKVTTYGCTMNQGEGRKMTEELAALGHEIVQTEEEADAVVVNTCDVIDVTERKILRSLHDLTAQSKKVIITGCMPAVDAAGLRGRFPEALVVPISDYPRFVEMMENRFGRGPAGPPRRLGPTGIIPIAQGCLGNCTYCITKLARGGLSSYPLIGILEAVKRELVCGTKEILLTAQDTGCYGADIGTSLPELIDRACALEGDFRVRVGMMNPDSLEGLLDETVKAFRNPKVYRFLHLPVQTGSDRLLRSMGRAYNAATFERQVVMFRAALPRLTLSTDIITGFPGETAEDHEASLDLLRRVRPNIVNVTRFSARPGTVASRMKGQVVSRVSKDRSREVARLRFVIAAELNQRLVGQHLQVIATEVGKNGSTICRDDCYASVVIHQALELGQGYKVEIKEGAATHLVGQLI